MSNIAIVQTERFYYELKTRDQAWDYGIDFKDEYDQKYNMIDIPADIINQYFKNKREFDKLQEYLSQMFDKLPR